MCSRWMPFLSFHAGFLRQNCQCPSTEASIIVDFSGIEDDGMLPLFNKIWNSPVDTFIQMFRKQDVQWVDVCRIYGAHIKSVLSAVLQHNEKETAAIWNIVCLFPSKFSVNIILYEIFLICIFVKMRIKQYSIAYLNHQSSVFVFFCERIACKMNALS